MGREFKPSRTPTSHSHKRVPNSAAASSGLGSDWKPRQTGFDYRSASLKIHGPVCARCGREFAGKNLRLLTVHHKDGNHNNNPRDGSNWENLCLYCHDAEHSRGLLADYVRTAKDDEVASTGKRGEKEPASKQTSAPGEVRSTLADKLKEAMEKSAQSDEKTRHR